MGYYKSLRDEQEASGFFTKRYFDEVCRHCIADEALAEFVAGHGSIKRCGFCDRANLLGTSIGELFHYMARCLSTEWDDPLNEVGWDHGFDRFVDVVDSYDLLWELEDPLGNEALQVEFVSAFEHQWCQLHPYRLNPAQVLFFGWERFAETVRTVGECSLQRPSSNGEEDSLDPTEVLDALGAAIAEVDSRMLRRSADMRIVRARAHDASRELDTAADLGSPPRESAAHNRMSGACSSMFYGAETAATAATEIKPEARHVVTCGTWRPSRELTYLDLSAARPVPSIFDDANRPDRMTLRFLADFADDLAKPVSEVDAATEYIPTQMVTEYMRDRYSTADGRHIDAIRYYSAQDRTDGICWVVFADHESCIDAGDEIALQATRNGDLLMILDPDSVRRYGPSDLACDETKKQ